MEHLDGADEARETYARLSQNWDGDSELLEAAVVLAVRAHHGQRRKSGDPYVTHPLAVAEMVHEWGMDSASVIAGLLHDVVEDTGVDLAEIRGVFGEEVAVLVDGLTKLDGVKFVDTAAGVDAHAAANLQKLLLAVADDPRVLVVKLADRLHNVKTLKALSESKSSRVARETLDVHAPLARRLGMAHVAADLEDRCFEVLYPNRYSELSRQVSARTAMSAEEVSDVQSRVLLALTDNGIEAEVTSRRKHLWSVYEKMVIKHRALDQIHDLVGVRILVQNISECYTALGVVHNIFQPVPGRFKDWLATPKSNMYQSLHTTVLSESGLPIEMQIRTAEMHQRSEWGLASHWRYKHDDILPRDSATWLRRLAEVTGRSSPSLDPTAFLEHVREELGDDDLYCFTPRGDAIGLPVGSSCVDFAYAVHTEIGNRCIGARVNGKLVPLATKLRLGDRVEVITGSSKGPQREWLDFTVSSRARSRIKQAVDKNAPATLDEDGLRALSAELEAIGVPQRMLRSDVLESVAEAEGCSGTEELLSKIASGNLRASAVAKSVAGVGRPAERDRGAEADGFHVRVEGLRGGVVRPAKCCHPVYGDAIVGFIVNRKAVEVHRAGCAGAVSPLDSWRAVEVSWEGRNTGVVVEVRVDAIDRDGLLADVARTFSTLEAQIVSSSTAIGRDMIARERFSIRLADLTQLDIVLEALLKVDGVYSAWRS